MIAIHESFFYLWDQFSTRKMMGHFLGHVMHSNEIYETWWLNEQHPKNGCTGLKMLIVDSNRRLTWGPNCRAICLLYWLQNVVGCSVCIPIMSKVELVIAMCPGGRVLSQAQLDTTVVAELHNFLRNSAAMTFMGTRMVPWNSWLMDVYSPTYGKNRFWPIGPSPYIELEEFTKLEQLAVWGPNHL